jgi:hypothetical protein
MNDNEDHPTYGLCMDAKNQKIHQTAIPKCLKQSNRKHQKICQIVIPKLYKKSCKRTPIATKITLSLVKPNFLLSMI